MLWAVIIAFVFMALFFLARRRPAKAGAGLERLSRFHVDEGGSDRTSKEQKPGTFQNIMELPYRLAPLRIKKLISVDIEQQAATSELTTGQLAGIRIWGTISFPAVVLLAFRFSAVGVMLSIPGALLGIVSPRIILKRDRDRYLERVMQALPHMADMLYAFVLGGKNLEQAFQRAAGLSREPLHSLLDKAVRQMQMGSTKEESFFNILESCPLPELSSLLNSLLEAERRGYPLAGTLEVYSSELRLRRRDQVRVAVAKAPLKILAPLIFLILPSSVILTVGPILLTTLTKGF